MADTDDEQTVALEPDQPALSDDDSPEALSERRDAGKWVRDDERPAAVLTPEEARRKQEELEDELHEKRVELAAKDEQELRLIRRRGEILDARTETSEAFRLAYADEVTADRLRSDADAERRQGRSDRAHGRHLLDEAAARPDEPGADATAAAGRRYERAANREERSAKYDDGVADRSDAQARDRRSEAARQPGQPPADEAVRIPPRETPVASKFVRRKQKHAKKKRKEFRPGELGNVGLGED